MTLKAAPALRRSRTLFEETVAKAVFQRTQADIVAQDGPDFGDFGDFGDFDGFGGRIALARTFT